MIHHYKNATALGVFAFVASVLAAKLRLVDGFQPLPAAMRTTTTTTQLEMSKNRRHGKKSKNKNLGRDRGDGSGGGSLTPSVVDKDHPSVESAVLDPVHVDLQHAKDVVDHFGDYTAKQIQKTRDDLHAHRVQGMVFGADETTAPEEMFEERVLEDELNLQLHLLQSQEPESYLFPEDEIKMDVVEKTDEPIQKLHSMEVAEHKQELDIEKEVFLLEELAEEGVLESLAFCAVIAMLVAAPAFFH